MKQNPVYYSVILAAAGYLLFANARGWSLAQSAVRAPWFPGSRAASFSHK